MALKLLSESAVQELQALCDTLSPIPRSTIFEDEIYPHTYGVFETAIKSTLSRTIFPLLVPKVDEIRRRTISAEDYDGTRSLDLLIEHTHSTWLDLRGCSLFRPRPMTVDLTVGFDHRAFSESALRKLLILSNGPGAGVHAPLVLNSPDRIQTLFPFLISVSYDDTDGSLTDAQFAASDAADHVIEVMQALYRCAGAETEIDNQVLAFSIVHSARLVTIFGHYYIRFEDGVKSSLRYLVRSFPLDPGPNNNQWGTHRFTEQLYKSWAPAHLARIVSAIDRIPDHCVAQYKAQDIETDFVQPACWASLCVSPAQLSRDVRLWPFEEQKDLDERCRSLAVLLGNLQRQTLDQRIGSLEARQDNTLLQGVQRAQRPRWLPFTEAALNGLLRDHGIAYVLRPLGLANVDRSRQTLNELTTSPPSESQAPHEAENTSPAGERLSTDPVPVSEPAPVPGPVRVSEPVRVSGPVPASGPVPVSDPIYRCTSSTCRSLFHIPAPGSMRFTHPFLCVHSVLPRSRFVPPESLDMKFPSTSSSRSSSGRSSGHFSTSRDPRFASIDRELGIFSSSDRGSRKRQLTELDEKIKLEYPPSQGMATRPLPSQLMADVRAASDEKVKLEYPPSQGMATRPLPSQLMADVKPSQTRAPILSSPLETTSSPDGRPNLPTSTRGFNRFYNTLPVPQTLLPELAGTGGRGISSQEGILNGGTTLSPRPTLPPLSSVTLPTPPPPPPPPKRRCTDLDRHSSGHQQRRVGWFPRNPFAGRT